MCDKDNRGVVGPIGSCSVWTVRCISQHGDVIKWKHFPLYWTFVRGIHRLPMDSPHKGQWCGAWMFSLICAWTNDWVNNRDAGDLKRHHAHYDVNVMKWNMENNMNQLISMQQGSFFACTQCKVVSRWWAHPQNDPCCKTLKVPHQRIWRRHKELSPRI